MKAGRSGQFGWRVLPILTVVTIVLSVPAMGQTLPGSPAGQPEEDALQAVGILDEDVELFGRLAYLWQLEDGTQVIQYLGDFSAHVGLRRLRSQNAVIWVHQRTYDNRPYLLLEIYLHRDAYIREAGGTVSTFPTVLVELRSAGKLYVSADSTAQQSAQEDPLYRQALAARDTYRGAQPEQPAAPGAAEAQIIPVPEEGPPQPARPGAMVRWSARNLRSELYGAQRVIVAIGQVYVARGEPGGLEYVELRADSAVIYLSETELESAFQPLAPSEPLEPPPGQPGQQPLFVPPEPPRQLTDVVSGVYLEGDVVLARGERVIRASQLYYDFDNDRAIILDAVMRAIIPERNIPIYVRSYKIRQLAMDQYEALEPQVSTSEFYTPHYHLGAQRVWLRDRTPRDEAGEIVGVEAGTYRMYNTTFNVGGVPLVWWPYLAGDYRRGDIALRGASLGYSGDFGLTGRTQWHLFNLLALEPPEGFDATLRLDYYAERGPAVGIDLDYERSKYFGLFRSYYVYDTEDRDNLGAERDNEFHGPDRGRILWRHRHYLPKDWELTLELAYISDANFLEEYFESEFDEGKPQESLIYLKKQRDHWAFTTLLQWRIMDFLTTTEHLPDAAFYLIGEPLGNWGTLYHESRVGLVRYLPDSRQADPVGRFRKTNRNQDSSVSPRADIREELTVPLKLGPLNLAPFGVVRGTAWDDTPDVVGDGGGAARAFAMAGLRASAYVWRVFPDVESRLFDLHGLRHVIKPDATFWVAADNEPSSRLFPFDPGIEDIDDFDGLTVGVRQLWQTKRGGAGRWRSVDWITFDLELGAFNDPPNNEEITNGDAFQFRPETSISRNFISSRFNWRISDSTVLLHDANWDLNDGQLDVSNLSLAVERSPRLAYFLGWRMIDETNSNLLGGGINYRLSPKHTVALRESFDLQRGETEEFNIIYIRKLPRWYLAFTFELDETEDDVGVSVAIWPEGLPEFTLGAKRYGGLAHSTGLRP